MDKNLENLNAAIGKLHWLKRWFLPSKLLNALRIYKNQPGSTTQFQAYVAFENTWLFLKWIFSCLSSFRKTSGALACTLLKKFELLSEENLSALLNHLDSKGLLDYLSKAKTLDKTSFDLLVQKPYRITVRVKNTDITPRDGTETMASSRFPNAEQWFNSGSGQSTPESAVVVTSHSSVSPGTSGSDASDSDLDTTRAYHLASRSQR